MSLLVHGLCVGGAVLLLSDLRLATEPEPFRWEIALADSPAPRASAPASAPDPMEPAARPAAVPKVRPKETAQPSRRHHQRREAPASSPPSERDKSPAALEDRVAKEAQTEVPPQPPADARPPASKPDYSWLAEALGSRIHALTRYPLEARLNRMEGRVVLQVVIQEDGQLHQVEVVKTSGHEVLDRSAREVILRASPLPLKHPLGRSRVVVQVPITYRLDQQ